MNKALVVGINHYARLTPLRGCVRDAHDVKSVLERHADGSVNFDVRLLTASGPGEPITRRKLKDEIGRLFSGDDDIALFYFAGHGELDSAGGYLLTSDADAGDEGVALIEIAALANPCKSPNRIIVLDCCRSGSMGTNPITAVTELREGMTILTASTADQLAIEDGHGGGGVFTQLFVDALNGSAANLVGAVTPGSVYAHVDQSLGPWDQRPVFKTNVKAFVTLRNVPPPLDAAKLRRITEFFPERGSTFELDPTFEPERGGPPPGLPAPIEEHVEQFRILQSYNRVNLVVPVDAPHMWHAAMQHKRCRLTALGEHYRRLVKDGRI